ncbi:hypothetical protein SUZIE_162910 [Sciurus carolinensis]|uniref:Uncharacterized protein n=1 Tax=Sciurus carolinensis TaxID=30640 RepID=A0AA41N0G2_SCICA|nr:hypothetical protein [Sciurus carolinensis]
MPALSSSKVIVIVTINMNHSFVQLAGFINQQPPPSPGSEGSRRTCPFHCGSLCPAWRQSWIAGFPFLPDWAPLDSLYHPVPGGP